ncbi:GIY-YIG nuclease family protein [Sphingomonas lenta]|uniref:GIY-YIG nuclease family protein n=1 Tax=Sphingomonas lenta TaxID=1141887 RepID=UPI001C3EBD8C|nr:GIY-YIG nuclease family protein [Sphingomonas lenta]
MERTLPATDDLPAIRVGSVKYGVYAFLDFDDQPIYVGQTRESIGTRVRRHLTNQRTDAVAMSVLDPFEVRSVLAWPLREYQGYKASGDGRTDKSLLSAAQARLNALERLVFERLVEQSDYEIILNEKDPPVGGAADWFEPIRGDLFTGELLVRRGHPDTRLARRTSTLARLAQVISERELKSGGLRRALLAQAVRIENLARKRYGDLGGDGSVLRRTGKGGNEDGEDV